LGLRDSGNWTLATGWHGDGPRPLYHTIPCQQFVFSGLFMLEVEYRRSTM